MAYLKAWHSLMAKAAQSQRGLGRGRPIRGPDRRPGRPRGGQVCGPGRSMCGHEWARTRGDVWTGAGRVPSRQWCECRSCRGSRHSPRPGLALVSSFRRCVISPSRDLGGGWVVGDSEPRPVAGNVRTSLRKAGALHDATRCTPQWKRPVHTMKGQCRRSTGVGGALYMGRPQVQC